MPGPANKPLARIAGLAACLLLLTATARVTAAPMGGQDNRVPQAARAGDDAAAKWRIVHRGPTDLYHGIDGLSDDDIWVAGAHRVRTGTNDYSFFPMLEGWNGAEWAKAPMPPMSPTTQGWFWDVAAPAEDDVWAAGITWKTSSEIDIRKWKQLLAHYDGTTWRVFRPPLPERFSKLEAITAIAPDDVWAIAVGASQPFEYLSKQQLFGEHWDGLRWSVTKLPLTSAFIHVNDIDAREPNDVWVVGDVSDYSNKVAPMSIHWDGRRWRVTEPPFRESCRPSLRGVAVLSPRDVWAVGNSDGGECGSAPQITHWNGRHWRLALQPRGAIALADVDASSRKEVWIVGSAERGSLVEHWNGTGWRQIVGQKGVFKLDRVRVISASDLWALGATTNDISVVVRTY